MAASITDHLQIFKRPQLPHFSTGFDRTSIKFHGLLRSFIQNIVIIRVAVPFKAYVKHVAPRMGPFWQHGHNFNKPGEGVY